MKTIFLAAGRSSRMDPISDKNFLDFLGEPLLLHLLRNAHQAGCADFIIVGNDDNKDKITNLCKFYDFLRDTTVTTQANLNDGMAGGVLAGLEFVEDDEAVLIHNGNDFVEFTAIKEVISATRQNDGALLGQKVENYFPGGYLEVEGDTIKSIIEKPGEGNEPSDLVNIVVHGFSKAGDLKQALMKAKSSADDVYEVALDTLFKTKNFKAVKYDGVWQAIKYPWHVLEMMEVLLTNNEKRITNNDFIKTKSGALVHKDAQVSEKATLKGDNVIIAAGARIFENAVVSGPAYIGVNAVVGNNALVRNSIVGENSTVGYNTEIARSWIGDNVTTHIAYIGDSIIDDEVNFGAYSCTANMRLDKMPVRVKIKEELVDSNHLKLGAIVGKGTQIGIGAKLMPGCKTPVQTLVRPGEIWY